jgi:hypothetical protein
MQNQAAKNELVKSLQMQILESKMMNPVEVVDEPVGRMKPDAHADDAVRVRATRPPNAFSQTL